MKKTILCLLTLLVMSCSADLSKYTQVDENASYKVKIKACLINQANKGLQEGTLFTNSVTATAKELVSYCIKDLALQSVEIEQESQSTAEAIIQNLKDLATK